MAAESVGDGRADGIGGGKLMARYKVEIMETLRYVVEVEAGSQKMAEQIVNDRWKDGEYILDADNFAGVEFKAVPVNR